VFAGRTSDLRLFTSAVQRHAPDVGALGFVDLSRFVQPFENILQKVRLFVKINLTKSKYSYIVL
jgi:hypothetical protein